MRLLFSWWCFHDLVPPLFIFKPGKMHVVVPYKAIILFGWELYRRCERVPLVQLVQQYQLQNSQDQQWHKTCVTSHPWQRDDF